MYDGSPAYFKQFQKNFLFFVLEEKPSSMIVMNYAEYMHFVSGYCEVLHSNHYHVLFLVSAVSMEILKRTTLYAVLCIYTTFRSIFSNGTTVMTTGEIFEKLKFEVEYNGSARPTKREATANQKRLPILSKAVALSKNHRQTAFIAYLCIMLRKHQTSNYKLTGYQLKFKRDLKTFCMVLILVLLAK